jgi:adenylosuccinate lyase
VCEAIEAGAGSVPVSGQTYSRKMDFSIMEALSGVAQSASKMCTDLRLLAHDGEMMEPTGAAQVGSSAMPYKSNPMMCERVCSLARFIIGMGTTAATTAATQWLERSLDDSAIRRITIPEAFLACDAMLTLVHTIAEGLLLNERVVASNLQKELPFMAMEAILMAGGDRQERHEALRVHSREARLRMVNEGAPNDLLDRIRADPLFANVHAQLDSFADPSRFVGCAPEQVNEFLEECVEPALEPYAEAIAAPPVDCVHV